LLPRQVSAFTFEDPTLLLFGKDANILGRAAKRLPYCDHIIALDNSGSIVEQGTYDKLNTLGGYVSNFDLPPPDWDFTPEKHLYEAPPRYTERMTNDKVTEEDIQAEANRRTGDSAIYLYYVRSVGWVPTMIFVVSITIFIFGQLFPSKSSLCHTICFTGVDQYV
jgi:hypothetical protein